MSYLAALALFLSGAACLMAQVTIQKYAQIVFGGLNVVIMYMVSFSFIAGLSAGSLLSARYLCPGERQQERWAVIEFSNALFTLAFLWAFSFVIAATFALGKAMYLTAPALYYVYAIGVTTITSFLLALIMGANYPLAFEATVRRSSRQRYLVAVFILATNTIGAAAGSYGSVLLMPHFGMSMIMGVGAACFMLAGLLVVADTAKARCFCPFTQSIDKAGIPYGRDGSARSVCFGLCCILARDDYVPPLRTSQSPAL